MLSRRNSGVLVRRTERIITDHSTTCCQPVHRNEADILFRRTFVAKHSTSTYDLWSTFLSRLSSASWRVACSMVLYSACSGSTRSGGRSSAYLFSRRACAAGCIVELDKAPLLTPGLDGQHSHLPYRGEGISIVEGQHWTTSITATRARAGTAVGWRLDTLLPTRAQMPRKW
jgi:hypothetical protein